MTDQIAPKVRILLDVDGVLNAVTKTPDHDVWHDWRETKVKFTDAGLMTKLTIRYSPSCMARVLDLVSRPGVECRWLTTWEDLANQRLCPLFGWPRFPVIFRHDLVDHGVVRDGRQVESGLIVSTSGWWKFDEARALYEQDGVPFVWIDDDLGFSDDGASEWVCSLDGNALGIRPDLEKGLTPHLLDEVEAFVGKVLSDSTGRAGTTSASSDPLRADDQTTTPSGGG